MGKPEPAGKTELFGFDAYSPAEIEDKVEKLGVKKAMMPFLPSFMLSVVAGGAIGLGGLYFCVVLADPTLSFALQRVIGGMVFSLGLSLVLIGGAELFTGNNLIVMAWANGQLTTWQVTKNWIIVWVGNLVGSLGLVFVVYMSHHMDMNGGAVGMAVLKLTISKIQPDAVTIFFKGVLCNLLVCLAVWLSYAGRNVADKMLAMVLPVSAFVAAGFEHCIANQYFLPLGWLLVATGDVPAGLDVSAITLSGVAHNLLFATLGNIFGGSVMVGGIYWLIYRKGLGGLTPVPRRETHHNEPATEPQRKVAGS